MMPVVKQRCKVFDPLVDFYRWAGLSFSLVKLIDGALMPQPYRGLLVHDRDMTPTLEEFWGETIHILPLQVREADGVLYRQVVLVTDLTGTRVAFGTIRIHLQRFDADARSEILACETPLGGILRDLDIPHNSRPAAFFSVTSERATSESLRVRPGCTLFGRHNVLEANGQPLAEVVEILPIIDERTAAGNL